MRSSSLLTVAAIAGLASLAGFSCSRPSGDASSGSAASRSEIVQIASAKDLTCARTRAGEVLCWGDDAFSSVTMSASALPAPTRTRPAPVEGVRGAVTIDVASSLGCAIDGAGAVLCWMDGAADRRGPAPPLRATPTGMTDAAGLSLGLAAAASACVIKKDRSVRCMSSDRGKLPRSEATVESVDAAEAFATGDMIRCAVRAGGKLACWGGSAIGLKSQREALAGPPLLEGVKDVSAGSSFACAVGESGTVACFGTDKGRPPSIPAKLVRAGVYHACLVDTGGHVHCWGDDRFGQLGEQGAGGVEGVLDAIDVAVGEWHTCALEKSGRVRCWGRNARGQLGDGGHADRRRAKEVSF
ncbi:MAG: hypothetical protein QM820_42485 [Minicystis sp.]